MTSPQIIPIWPMDAPSLIRGTYWSHRLGLPLLDHPGETNQPMLAVNGERLELRHGSSRQRGVYVEFSLHKARMIQRQEGKNGLLTRAIGLRKHPSPTVWDATAGLGQDGFFLACQGCQVRLFERSPIIAALLEDGLSRGLVDHETQPVIEQRMILSQTDAAAAMHNPPYPFPADVIYLDPMFTKPNATALSKKEMQLLRLLVGNDDDAPTLLATAIACQPRRVVVKRPLKASPLGERPPHFSIQGTTIRYDVYLPEMM
ncbi:MAG: class I SAM-dependent methyltransferase [Magnetococcales bacterium]|nr:class I SAM-dependent methyltransferase [Magnetococcales bacterium]